MKKKEIILFAILFVVALAWILIMQFAPSSTDKVVLITVDGEEYKRIAIDAETKMSFTVETKDGVNEVVIADGKVSVVSADCPNQVCVDTKSASEVYDIIVCLPHRVVIEIIEDE